MYKAKILSYLEYRTPAIYHATATLLHSIDCIQEKMLREVGVTNVDALLKFHLAPLNARRDMAMLGLIHRCVLGLGPEQFREFFKMKASSAHPDGRNTLTRHNLQVETHRNGKFLDMLKWSVLGLVDIYNLLPQNVVNAKTVRLFQRRLQDMLREVAKNENAQWGNLFSPRLELWNHPLVNWRSYKKGCDERIVVKDNAPARCIDAWINFGNG